MFSLFGNRHGLVSDAIKLPLVNIVDFSTDSSITIIKKPPYLLQIYIQCINCFVNFPVSLTVMRETVSVGFSLNEAVGTCYFQIDEN